MTATHCILLLLFCGSFCNGGVIQMDIPDGEPAPSWDASPTDSPIPPGTETKYLDVLIDHFSFTKSDTFKLRYLINSKYWSAGKPIFFYTGNEGTIELFAENTGFVWEIAPDYNAMVVFAEHRYYGDSLPFGSSSFNDSSYFGYLTASQALADFVDVINFIKGNITGADSSPVITFGGSYGGMLSAWIRMKYPNVVAGAIAASAPILAFPGIQPVGCDGFSMVTTRTYLMADSNCPDMIQQSWNFILNSTTSSLTKTFNLCAPLKSQRQLSDWLQEAYGNMAMVDYPYPANFIANLPTWPVKTFCSKFVNSPGSLLDGLSQAIKVYYNTSGNATCLNLTQDVTPNLGATGWSLQSCMEMVMPMCSTGQKDMFLPSDWDYTAYTATCKANYGVTPRPQSILSEFWGKLFAEGATNILFSNGDLDPWSSMGVTESPNPDTLPVIVINNAAHHLDLRASNPLDPKTVTDARTQEKTWISKWIANWSA